MRLTPACCQDELARTFARLELCQGRLEVPQFVCSLNPWVDLAFGQEFQNIFGSGLDDLRL